MKLLLLASAALLAADSAAAQKPQQNANQPHNISRAEYLKSVTQRFTDIDTNHDGVVTKQELAVAEAKLAQQLTAARDQKMRAEFSQLDTNHDGKLSLEEFMAAAPQVRAAQTPDQIIQQLDTNHDGTISADEFRAPEIAKFNKVDANHDGIVTPAEIQAAAGKK
jgi:Ca2+-binding EF-hand superfamily protein